MPVVKSSLYSFCLHAGPLNSDGQLSNFAHFKNCTFTGNIAEQFGAAMGFTSPFQFPSNPLKLKVGEQAAVSVYVIVYSYKMLMHEFLNRTQKKFIEHDSWPHKLDTQQNILIL